MFTERLNNRLIQQSNTKFQSMYDKALAAQLQKTSPVAKPVPATKTMPTSLPDTIKTALQQQVTGGALLPNKNKAPGCQNTPKNIITDDGGNPVDSVNGSGSYQVDAFPIGQLLRKKDEQQQPLASAPTPAHSGQRYRWPRLP